MRVGNIEIVGKNYPACLSTGLVIKCEERTGLQGAASVNAIIEDGKLSSLFWLLHEMIVAGCRYKQLTGEENVPDAIPLEDMQDLVGPEDYQNVFGTMYATINGGVTPEVTVEPSPKNAEASPDN